MNTNKSSRLQGFYKKSNAERIAILKQYADLSDHDVALLKKEKNLSFGSANRMIENVVSTMPIPLGIAANFLINDKDYLIPMATEEPSVVAAASYAAKLARFSGGFQATRGDDHMIGQIHMKNITDIVGACRAIEMHKSEILEHANRVDVVLTACGGGAVDLQVRVVQTQRGAILTCHLIVDVKDAMGANIVNTMTEAIAPLLEKITRGFAFLRIMSNLAVHRIARAQARWSKEVLGARVIEGILDAYALALADPFRCATHNKGIMNGIDAVALATGNDFRALEAGAHAFASMHGSYRPLTTFATDAYGDLIGQIELPLAVGIKGGVTQTHPMAQLNLKILGVESAGQFAQILASVGLAQNFAALRALVTEGIQTGHMRLHSKNIAIMAGAEPGLVDEIAQKMCAEKNISVARAQELLHERRSA